MKVIVIDGKEYEVGSVAHLDKIAADHDAEVKALTVKVDSAERALKDSNEAASKAKADHEAAVAAEKARADKAEAELKLVPKRIAEGVRVQTLAAKVGITKVTKDGKEVDVADADMTATLLAIAKKALPQLDLSKLALTPEQLLEMIAQTVGAAAAAPAAEGDGDPMASEEDEPGAPLDGGRGGSVLDALAKAEGAGAKPKKAKARSYQDSRDEMLERIRNASERPKRAPN